MRKIWTLLLISVFLTILYYLVWGVFRGFEITDEGFYLLMYEKPDNYAYSALRYFVIINKLFSWLDPQIYHYRLMTIFFNFAGSCVFFAGVWKYFKNHYQQKSTLWIKFSAFLFVATGNFVAIFMLFKLIGYNDLNNFFILSATGLALLSLAIDNKKFSRTLMLLTGVFIALDVFVKFTTAFVLSGFLILFIIFSAENRLNRLKYLFIGIILGILLYFAVFDNPVEYFNTLIYTLKVGTGSTHSLKLILTNYLYFTVFAVKVLIKYFLLPLIVYLLTLVLYKFKTYKCTLAFGVLSIYMFFIAFVNSFVFAPLSGIGNIHVAMPVFLLLIFFQLLFLLFTKNLKNYSPKLIFLCVFLLALPFIMAFGSAAPITMMAYLHMSPLFALFIILNILSESPNLYTKTVNVFFSIIFIGLCVSHLYFLYLQNPFRLNDSMFEQNYRIEGIKKLDKITVDKKTKIFLDELNSLMQKAEFKENNYLVGHLMPGIVYIFDGISPGTIYYDSHAGSRVKNINALKDSVSILPDTYFLLPENCKLDICEYIEENSVLKNHEVVGSVENPYKPNILYVPNSPLILYKPVKKD